MKLQRLLNKAPCYKTKLLLPAALSLLLSPAISFAELEKFVDELPIPAVAKPTEHDGSYYRITMEESTQKLHRDLPPAIVWGYNGEFPGPTFKVKKGTPVTVEWQNHLPETHFLPIEPNLHGVRPDVPGGKAPPQVKTAIHLHGGKVLTASDGHPEAWFSPYDKEVGPYFVSNVYYYPNDQRAATLWYHDHSLGSTRLNVYAGLAGFYLISDEKEEALHLPRGRYDIPLIIQDRNIDLTTGQLIYPTQTITDDSEIRKIWVPEAFGDTVLVNGKIWPYLNVEPRKYRFRLLNGSNARFFNLTLLESDEKGFAGNKPGPLFHQIGTDGGLKTATTHLKTILIAPGERFDIIIDFADYAGKTFLLHNDGPAPFPDGGDVVPAEVMLFKVGKNNHDRDRSRLPDNLVEIKPLNPAAVWKTRDMTINELASKQDNPIIGLLDNKHFDEPITEEPVAGSVEIWRIINRTGDVHPLHVHPLQVQILDRQHFVDNPDLPQNATYEQLTFDQMPVKPDATEQGAWKDTVRTYPGEVTRVIARYELPRGPYERGTKFEYMWHCHILEHEDNEMMRPYNIVVQDYLNFGWPEFGDWKRKSFLR